jgi:hypothetical protein
MTDLPGRQVDGVEEACWRQTGEKQVTRKRRACPRVRSRARACAVSEREVAVVASSVMEGS